VASLTNAECGELFRVGGKAIPAGWLVHLRVLKIAGIVFWPKIYERDLGGDKLRTDADHVNHDLLQAQKVKLVERNSARSVPLYPSG
jgi:hypothetical protein